MSRKRARPGALEISDRDDAESERKRSESEAAAKRQKTRPSFTPGSEFDDEPAFLDQEERHGAGSLLRALDYFTFFDTRTLEMVPFVDLLEGPQLNTVAVVGDISVLEPYDLDPVDEDDDDIEQPHARKWTPVKITGITSLVVDYSGVDANWVHAKDTITLFTERATYILACPHNDYIPSYEEGYVACKISQFIVRKALECPGWKTRAVVERAIVQEWEGPLGRMLNIQDMRGEREKRIRTLLGKVRDNMDRRRADGDDAPTVEDFRLVYAFLNEVAPHHDPPRPQLRVMPTVSRLARLWFRTPWESLNVTAPTVPGQKAQPLEEEPLSTAEDFFRIDLQEGVKPASATLAVPFEQESKYRFACTTEKRNAARYKEMRYNGRVYEAHHVVKILGIDPKTEENVLWYARIAYFFVSETGEKMMHAEYFDRACAEDILDKFGHEHEMFVVLHCGDVAISSILGAPVKMWSKRTTEGLFCESLFNGSGWERVSFVHALYNRHGSCFVGAYTADRHAHLITDERPTNHTLRIRGHIYHEHDFVYLQPRVDDVSTIAQVRHFKNDGTVDVTPMTRGRKDGHAGARTLKFSGDRMNIPPLQIVGLCRVVPRPLRDRDLDDPWIFTARDVHQWCGLCLQAEDNLVARERQFAQEQRKLAMLDTYCGAGGLALGLERGSGCIEAKYAVDINSDAAKAFKKAHAETLVFNEDASRYLACVGYQMGVNDIDGAPLPERQSVDVVCAGVPCQGHTTLNIHRTADDPKNCQILTALSFVEKYRPKFFVLENVVHIMSWQLMARTTGQGRIRGGIQYGGLRLVISILIELGYQVRVGLLNAGMYGAPQNRRRFFIVASDAEHELPDFPHPTHAFPKSLTLKIPAFPEARPSWPVVESTRTGDDYDIMRQSPLCVPHPTVTLKDGIGDLHKFDWKSSERRPQRPVDAFLCKPKGCEPTFRTPYAMEPANEVQARARRDSAGITFKKLQHKTAGFFQYIVENVWDIPYSRSEDRESDDEGGDYRSIDQARRRQGYGIGDPVGHVARSGFSAGKYYRRLRWDRWFSTLVTEVRPTAKQSRVLLPDQNRIVTVREQARGQGFPDDFEFQGDTAAMHAQIGNAVPVPLAEALGRQIRAVLMKKMFEQTPRKDSAD
ncbi:S-adenosyl-L-methionine-dependent methyltransferase [Exidia glandulosa HHB12029]|uniref:DNA (cytosine-5-)-methyltransferase n=1 Tax=Exidia glandulosa HHB12029 TaxID=1314781 RepID=A0A166B4N1_EXIGL|nr:S-adenosyl-L-methionine-dependent methyltransferase [Exidia glandulosa HHB12029]